MTTNVHYATPNVAVFDNRGLTLRKIGYCRSEVGQTAEERISRSTYDIAGNVQSSVDPRLFHNADAANFRFQPTLAGYMARIDSADAGSRWQLNDIEGRPIWQRDARGTEQRYHYDAAGRVVERLENTRSQERWTYGENTADPQRRNLRGQVAERTDPAGTLSYTECGYSLLGRPWQQTRHLDEQQYTTRWRYDAQSRPLRQTDAKGHRQYSVYDVAGRLQSSTLVVNGGTDQPRTVVADTLYNAAGKKLRVTFGNGVITRYDYEPQTQRLTGITSTRPGKPPLQRLRYQYDPAGNLLQITDEAQPVRYFRNQKTDGTKTFRYDSLYQLIEATGRENATAIDSGNDDIQITSLDAEYVNYTRAYDYDAGGNLLKTCHCGAASYTRQLTVAATSNRAISGANLAGDDIDEHFDACGNPKQLDSGQTLQWNGLSQLASITTIARADSDDGEVYLYDGDGQRLRKTNRSLASIRSSNRINIQDTLYLPGLELRNSGAEQLQVINAGSARVLYWTAGKPDDIDNPQLRYQLDAPTGSSQIELDDQADIITQEDYYPYGGTAVRSGRTTSEVDYKTQRYGGHERDTSGLYCDGAGYYQPWLGRRLSSDSNNGGGNGYWMWPSPTIFKKRYLTGMQQAQYSLIDDGESSESTPIVREETGAISSFFSGVAETASRFFSGATGAIRKFFNGLAGAGSRPYRGGQYSAVPPDDVVMRSASSSASTSSDFTELRQQESSFSIGLSDVDESAVNEPSESAPLIETPNPVSADDGYDKAMSNALANQDRRIMQGFDDNVDSAAQAAERNAIENNIYSSEPSSSSHGEGQPLLSGSGSVEVSEHLEMKTISDGLGKNLQTLASQASAISNSIAETSFVGSHSSGPSSSAGPRYTPRPVDSATIKVLLAAQQAAKNILHNGTGARFQIGFR